MIVKPPPNPFLDARDLNTRYATQIRKLSNQPVLLDGDVQFRGVDTFRPAHELEPGLCADAVNKRSEDGRAWPRNGAAAQPWGAVSTQGQNMVGGQSWPATKTGILYIITMTNFLVGQQYIYLSEGNASMFWTTETDGTGTVPITPGEIFTATQTTYRLASSTSTSTPCTSVIVPYPLANVVGFARFNDPQGYDTTVVLTDDWRDGSGEDGGRGRCWKVRAGNAPVDVPMNGHDIYGITRAVPCHNGLVLLRQDNERHYFGGAAASGTAQIQLNTEPAWATGDLVLFGATENSYFTGTTVPNPQSRYYVKNITGNKVELYTDASLTTKVNFTGATGKFWLERQAQTPGFYGNGAPALLAQPNALGDTLWDVGFVEAPISVDITNVTSNLVTAPNHRLLPGDAISVTVITLIGGGALPATVYANPVSDHALYLYDTAIDALAGGATGLQALANNSTPTNATIVKNGASGLPMPSGREGCYFQNRLVIVNGNDTIIVSDPLDPLHYTPLSDAVTANLGESDPITFLLPIPSQDALMIGKENEVFILNNFGAGTGSWSLNTITREYGCIAPLTAVQVGADVWFLSRKGVASITQTIQGVSQGVALPVSKPMKKYVDLIDWNYASQACAQYWNNRFYVAVPLKGQTGARVNNGWLVYNFLTQAWEGLWQGAALAAVAMARTTVYGDIRMCWVTPAGQVSWLTDGWLDPANTPISDSLTTRIYTCGQKSRKLHLAAEWNWDAYNPTITATAQTPGVNETEVLLPAPIKYSNTKYDVAGLVDYVPGQGLSAVPYRDDYSPPAVDNGVISEIVGVAQDVHQNHTEGFRFRLDDWGIQFVIANRTGSLRLQSVALRAVGGPNLQGAQL